MKKMIYGIAVGAVAIIALTNCTKPEENEVTQQFERFLADYESKVVPLSRDFNLAYFNATISGKEEDYNRSAALELQLGKIHADKAAFEELKRINETNAVTDPILKRQLDLLLNDYLEKQMHEDKLEAIIKLQSKVEKSFSTFRVTLNNEQMTDNQIKDILKQSTDTSELMAAWLASKTIGGIVSDAVLELVRMRNAAASDLGFANFHAMQLAIGEQKPDQIEALFDELDELTRDAYSEVKQDIDRFLAKHHDIKTEELMPWHYQNPFFQEAPNIYGVEMDEYFRNQDLVEISKTYFAGMGIPIDDMIANSDLFEKEGKYQHAYCTDIDREGDVRVVCNIKPNFDWISTTLHEYGHAVYSKYHDRTLPWRLRDAASTFATEGIAMLVERFATNAAWMQVMIGISDAEKEKVAREGFKILRLKQLVFSRWAQVMYRFEKAMYENPEQDLNKLWWDLVEDFQMIKRPPGRNKPDWASKIHVALYPAYYHNYLMGELFASQLFYYITSNVLKSDNIDDEHFIGEKAVGQYLIEKVFKPGAKYYWNDMVEKATREKLTAQYFARQFVD